MASVPLVVPIESQTARAIVLSVALVLMAVIDQSETMLYEEHLRLRTNHLKLDLNIVFGAQVFDGAFEFKQGKSSGY